METIRENIEVRQINEIRRKYPDFEIIEDEGIGYYIYYNNVFITYVPYDELQQLENFIKSVKNW